MDQKKAFDQVSWDFMNEVMKKYNFNYQTIKTINTFYKDINSLINVNGTLSTPFQIQRGVRQGCPLSVILYILVAEAININIKENQKINGIKIPGKKDKIKNIMFADDLTLIMNNINDYDEAMKTMNEYCGASGAELN